MFVEYQKTVIIHRKGRGESKETTKREKSA